jgi:hypothetical protein
VCAAVIGLVAAGCGSSSTVASTGEVAGPGAQTSLVSNCVADYANGDYAPSGATPSATGAASYCGCVIKAMLKAGLAAGQIANAMQTAATDGDYAAPPTFGLYGSCGPPPAVSLGDQ